MAVVMEESDAGAVPVPPPRVKKLARLAARRDRERRSVTWVIIGGIEMIIIWHRLRTIYISP